MADDPVTVPREGLGRMVAGVEYRRRDFGHGWILMAAFDVEGAAESYFKAQREDAPWVYRVVRFPDTQEQKP